MSQWNLAKYTKMCRSNNQGLLEDYEGVSDEMFRDLAQCILDMEKGLEDWIKLNLLKGIKNPDIVGCLTDDLAFPGNCEHYLGKVK